MLNRISLGPLGVVAAALLVTASTSWAGFQYEDFSSVAELTLVGDATQENSAVRVSPAAGWTAGGAWYSSKQAVAGGFTSTFTYRITARGPGGGRADGFAFVVQNDSATALGEDGEALGYGIDEYGAGQAGGIPNSLAVEFDTYRHFEFDEATPNHVSVQTRGLLPNSAHPQYSLGTTNGVAALDDEVVHTVIVHYDAQQLEVYVDDPLTPLLTVPVDLSSVLDLDAGSAWVGFTASSGAYWENHEILSWSFVPEPCTLGLLSVGCLALVRCRRRQAGA